MVLAATTNCPCTLLHHKSIKTGAIRPDIQRRNPLGARHWLGIEQQFVVEGKILHGGGRAIG
jgi:hypothetical protein